MSPSRLARYFKSSRDNWKNKALEKQDKLRGLEQKIRDLEKSREQWKDKAKKAEKKVKELEREREKRKKTDKSPSDFQKVTPSVAIAHHYTIQTIQISVQQVIDGGNSFRSVSTTMKLLSENFELDSPHFSSIRKWVGRVGLYELYRKKAHRNDWIFIVDLTLELGQEKAMIVYGVTLEKYQEVIVQEKRALKHTDGEILSLEVTATATGEFIQEKLELLSNEVGIQKNNPGVIYTYDVTHAMSNLLKQQLSQDETYQKFLDGCHQCRSKLQQTELAFLSPPSQRSQCRYFNIERLVIWGKQLLNAPLEVIVKLMPQADIPVIYQRLKDKLSWLINYEEPLKRWELMVFLTRSLETQVKIDGLHQQSLEKFKSQISSRIIPSDLLEFKDETDAAHYSFIYDEFNNRCC